MPGSIRVSVLEAVDLPEAISVGTCGTDVTAKVTLGTRQFKTESRVVGEGRINSWNSNFSFLVTNLRDKLVVAICDNEDQCLTQTSIEVPTVIERGSRDEFLELIGGGQIHLSISFILTDDEQKKIEKIRLAALKRREENCGKRTIVFQNVHSYSENDSASTSAVTITEVDDSSSVDNKDSQESANGPLGFCVTTKLLTPISTFDYARAVGLQSRQECKRIGKETKFWASENVSNKVKASIDDFNSEEQRVSLCAKNEVKVDYADVAAQCLSALSIKSLHRSASPLTRLPDSAISRTVPPFMQVSFTGKVFSGALEIEADFLESILPKVRNEFVVPSNVLEENKCFEDEGTNQKLDFEAAAGSNSFCKQSTLFGDMRKINSRNPNLSWDGQQALRALQNSREVRKLDVSTEQGPRPEARPGPGARWAHKTNLDSRWASSKKIRRFVRIEWNSQVSARFKARARILKLIKAAVGAHEAYGGDQTLQVVCGAAVLLAALFMIWPRSEDSSHRSDGSSGDDI